MIPPAEAARIERALARLPRWMLLLAVAGAAATAGFFGLSVAGGFLLGAIAAWFNLRVLERTVNRIAPPAGGEGREPASQRPGGRAAVWLYIQFASLISAAIVVLWYSGFSMVAALGGFLVCPAGVLLEIVYELATYDHS